MRRKRSVAGQPEVTLNLLWGLLRVKVGTVNNHSGTHMWTAVVLDKRVLVAPWTRAGACVWVTPDTLTLYPAGCTWDDGGQGSPTKETSICFLILFRDWRGKGLLGLWTQHSDGAQLPATRFCLTLYLATISVLGLDMDVWRGEKPPGLQGVGPWQKNSGLVVTF